MKRPYLKRSLIVSGHHTSISLEPEFDAEFVKLAQRRGLSLNALATEISLSRGANPNLCSAIRVAVLKDLLRTPLMVLP
jgi:predicted DNA-binding ribbon-helix-helix protein